MGQPWLYFQYYLPCAQSSVHLHIPIAFLLNIYHTFLLTLFNFLCLLFLFSYKFSSKNTKQFFTYHKLQCSKIVQMSWKRFLSCMTIISNFIKKNCEFLQLKLIPTTEIVTWLVDFQGIHFRKKSFLNLTTNFLWWCRMHKDIILPIKQEKYVIYQFSCFITLQLKLLRGT